MSVQARELFDKLGKVPWDVLEEFILSNAHIFRPIKGHCFETWFDKIILNLGIEITPGEGDDIVDRTLLEQTLQLKTPYANGTKDGEKVAYMLHKTHGLEKRPSNLYRAEDFADFLVGYHPDGVIICPRDSIPLQSDYPGRQWGEYLADPAIFMWNTEWLNRYDLLGLDPDKIEHLIFNEKNTKFPRIGEITKLSDEDIISTILKPSNFRILEQNLLGSIREWHFLNIARNNNINLRQGEGTDEIKVDYVLDDGRRIQVKGRTKSLCKDDTIGIEVKGSHGRIPQRLYRIDSFDFLVVVLDPLVVPEKYYPTGIISSEFNCAVIPAADLPIHPRSIEWGQEYFKDIFKFKISDYPINNLDLLI